MPNIVNQTFFVGDLTIPNLDHTATLEKLNYFIKKYEPDCLLKVLGYPLYKIFGVESSTRMTDLLEGAEYTDGEGELRKWQGVVHNANISFLANYIYFFYQKDRAHDFSGTGTSVPKAEAGVSISPAEKMTKAWNFFSSEIAEMSSFLWLKKIDGVRVYPEFSYSQFLETRRISRKIDSVFQF